MTSIALAACRLSADSPPDVFYPDADATTLGPALVAAGTAHVSVVSWDDPGVDWSSYDAVVISSTWDSVDRPAEYLAWTESVGSSSQLVNPPEVVAWNLDKRYLRDLAAAGLPIVPTTWVVPGDAGDPGDPGDAVSRVELPSGDVVVKPAVSAGGRSTAWYSASSHDAARAHIAELAAAGATVMVQEHVAGVASVGEVKSVYLDGAYSHAARVGGLLDRDGGIMDRPWEKAVSVTPVRASAVERSVGEAVLDVLAGRFGGPLAYARVDLVLDASGGPQVLEVELIDPVLFLESSPGAADRLAAAILRRVAGPSAAC